MVSPKSGTKRVPEQLLYNPSKRREVEVRQATSTRISFLEEKLREAEEGRKKAENALEKAEAIIHERSLQALYQQGVPVHRPVTTGTGDLVVAEPHLYPVHESAETCGDQIDKFVIQDVDKKMKDQNCVLHSIVLSSRIDSSSEPGFGHDVEKLLNDVLRAQKWNSLAYVRVEMTVARLRPDLLVLKKRDGSTAGFIEVKAPARSEEQQKKLFAHNEASAVGGQLFDYLELLANIGVDYPVGILHTFNSCMVVWSQRELPIPATAEFKLMDVSTTMSSGLSSPNLSPVPGSPCNGGTKQKPQGRKLYASKVYTDPKDVLFATTAAMRHMLASTCSSECSFAPRNGAQLHGCVVRRVCSQGVKYVTAPNMRVQYKRELSTKSTFYLVRPIGRGANALCYVAVDNEGCAGALKLYVNTIELAYTDEYGPRTKERARREASIWLRVNGQKARVFEIRSNGAPAYGLLMPYCRPLRGSERLDKLEEVKQALTVLASEGFRYRDRDVRWRHVAVRLQKDEDAELMLLDMDGLEELAADLDDVSKQEVVEEQVDGLRNRANEE